MFSSSWELLCSNISKQHNCQQLSKFPSKPIQSIFWMELRAIEYFDINWYCQYTLFNSIESKNIFHSVQMPIRLSTPWITFFYTIHFNDKYLMNKQITYSQHSVLSCISIALDKPHLTLSINKVCYYSNVVQQKCSVKYELYLVSLSWPAYFME